MEFQMRAWRPIRVVLGLAFLLLLRPLEPAQAERLRLMLNNRRTAEEPLQQTAPAADLAEKSGSSEEAEASAPEARGNELSGVQDESANNADANEVSESGQNESDTAGVDTRKDYSTLRSLALSLSETNDVLDAGCFSDQFHIAAKGCTTPPVQEEPSELSELLFDSRRCRSSFNPILVIDGGSTGTRGALFRVGSESCPNVGRRMKPEEIIFLEEGQKFAGLRQTMEKWLNENAGPDWASKPVDSKGLLQKFPSMLEAGRNLMHNILDNISGLIHKHFSDFEVYEAKTVGIPVLFFSTAGVRDTHDWYRRGLFTSFISAINSYSGHHGFQFFTNEDWTRPIPGVEEGMLAFTASNHLLGNFATVKELQKSIENAETEKEQRLLQQKMQESLTSIVEVGGASMQIVFPVFSVGSSPSFVNTTNLVSSGYLSSEYPSLDVMSTSYMQLGASSATGVFYMSYCSNPAHLKDGVCQNPCLPRGYRQKCSTGEVTITSETISVAEGVDKQRIKPTAYYCTSSNKEISRKSLNRLSCVAAGINPELELKERLEIAGCREMEGTGDFDKCSAAVNKHLLDPSMPLPANQEASYTGFDTPGQIFDFMATGTSVVITGKALVIPVQDLQHIGLLTQDFKGDPCLLHAAAKVFCSAPVEHSGGRLVRRLQLGHETKELPLTSFNVEHCLKLGMGHGLLKLLNKSDIHPQKISFELDIADPHTGKKVGEYGWPAGAILRAILDLNGWTMRAYALGKNHTTKDRWDARHPETEPKNESS